MIRNSCFGHTVVNTSMNPVHEPVLNTNIYLHMSFPGQQYMHSIIVWLEIAFPQGEDLALFLAKAEEHLPHTPAARTQLWPSYTPR